MDISALYSICLLSFAPLCLLLSASQIKQKTETSGEDLCDIWKERNDRDGAGSNNQKEASRKSLRFLSWAHSREYREENNFLQAKMRGMCDIFNNFALNCIVIQGGDSQIYIKSGNVY